MSTQFEEFCASFGNVAEVRAEIEEYWARGGSPFPQEVFTHLIQVRAHDKRRINPDGSFVDTDAKAPAISARRAKFLIDYFCESFAPEPTTGYAHRHRAPLIQSFVNEYAKSQSAKSPGEDQIYRVEADIMNLGGLNVEIERAGGDKYLADQVIGMMTATLQHALAPFGDICPVRHGGDEMSIFIKPHAGVIEEDIRRAMVEAQKKMAAIIKQAGLCDVTHLKTDRLPGVGIGCSVASLLDRYQRLKADVDLRDELEDGVKIAKTMFQAEIDNGRKKLPKEKARAYVDVPFDGSAPYPRYRGKIVEAASPDVDHLLNLSRIESALSHAEHVEIVSTKRESYSRLDQDKNFKGVHPEAARIARARRNFPKDAGSDPALEEHLLSSVVGLTQKIDFVTGRPLFGTMERTIMPNFRAEFGDKARLIHIDFNNMGGGNKLGSWVGDAMARAFGECIVAGMRKQRLNGFIPYLTSQGGGKFTLLLPQTKCDARAAEALTRAIEDQLRQRSIKPLDLSSEQVEISKQLLQIMEREERGKRAGGWEEGMPARAMPLSKDGEGNLIITLADISSSKSRRKGSHVVTLSPVIDLSHESPIKIVEILERMARHGQNSIEDYDHLKALDNKQMKGDGHYQPYQMQDITAADQTTDGAFTKKVGRKVDPESYSGTIRLKPVDKSSFAQVVQDGRGDNAERTP